MKRNYLAEYVRDGFEYGYNVYTPPGATFDPFAPDLGGSVIWPKTAEEYFPSVAALKNEAYRKPADQYEALHRAGVYESLYKGSYYGPLQPSSIPLYRGNYDDGGWLMPGLTLARNDTGVPERVVPPGGDTIRLDIHTDGPLTDSQVARLADAVKESLARDRRHAVFMTS